MKVYDARGWVFQAHLRADTLMLPYDTGQRRRVIDRINWITYILAKGVLMNHTREEWLAVKEELKKRQ